MKFEVASGGFIEFELEYDKELVESNLPIKLGDGNFGIVYAGSNQEHLYAIKIIYKHQAEDEASDGGIHHKLTRVQDELMVGSNIAKAIREKAKDDSSFDDLIQSYHQHLVLPVAFTENILAKDVFSNDAEETKFRDALEKLKSQDIEFSSYAYAMDRFQCSLKDLVEGEGSKGYLRLKHSPLGERERSALHVVLGIARGLKILHVSDLRHQDIKPANIYYKDNGAGEVDFRLGDLGFLRPQNPVLAGSAMVSVSDLAIGTKHYRSVEQIDYADTSEVSVEVDKNGDSAKLTSNDPKFLRTNIHIGDLAFFPRSKTQRLFKVTAIDFYKKTLVTEVEISLKLGEDETGKSAVFDDSNTQVSFVKNPSSKTDLFGLGATLFDIVTAGDSPERFYELLRKFDVRGNANINETILTYYSLWQAGQFIDPEVSAIFQRVCSGVDANVTGISEDVMAFLLRCCMSEPDDSFFRIYGFDSSEERVEKVEYEVGDNHHLEDAEDKNGKDTKRLRWEGVLREIDRLIDDTGATKYNRVNVNCLTGGKGSHLDGKSRPSTLLKYIPKIQGLTDDGNGALHNAPINNLVRGIVTVKKIADQARKALDSLSKNAKSEDYFSFAPEHLSFNDEFSAVVHNKHFGQLDKDTFMNKLRKLDVHLCASSPYDSRFSPIWWRNRSRRLNLSKLSSGENQQFQFQYMDFCSSWPGIETGDYLVVLGQGTGNALYIVDSAPSEKLLNCKAQKTTENSNTRWGQDAQGRLVKKINNTDYIMGMLSIYMFQLLFYKPDGKSVQDFGPKVSSKISSYPCVNLVSPTRINRSNFFEALSFRASKGKLSIASLSVRFCLWLMLGGFSSGDKSRSDDDKLKDFITEIDNWFKLCAETFNQKVSTFDNLSLNPKTDFNLKLDDDLKKEIISEFSITQEQWDQECDQYFSVKSS